MSERQTKAGNQITLSHSLLLSLSQSFTLSFTHSQHAEQIKSHCLLVKMAMLFLGPHPQQSAPSPVSLEFIALVPS